MQYSVQISIYSVFFPPRYIIFTTGSSFATWCMASFFFFWIHNLFWHIVLRRFVEELYTGSLVSGHVHVWRIQPSAAMLTIWNICTICNRNQCIFNHMMNMHESFCLVPEGKSVTRWTCMNPFVSQRMQEACALLFNSMPQRSVMLLQVLWRSLQESHMSNY